MPVAMFIPKWMIALVAVAGSGVAGVLFFSLVYMLVEMNSSDPFRHEPFSPYATIGLFLGLASVSIWWPA